MSSKSLRETCAALTVLETRGDMDRSVCGIAYDSREVKPGFLFVAMDGQRNLTFCQGSPVEISISPLKLPLVQRVDYSHFTVVRTKLQWSGGAAEAPKDPA